MNSATCKEGSFFQQNRHLTIASATWCGDYVHVWG